MLNYTEAARFEQNLCFELRAPSFDRTRTGCSKRAARSYPRLGLSKPTQFHVMPIIDPTSGKVL